LSLILLVYCITQGVFLDMQRNVRLLVCHLHHRRGGAASFQQQKAAAPPEKDSVDKPDKSVHGGGFHTGHRRQLPDCQK